MPGFDGTGPLGQGPMTGRGCGFCVLINSKQNPGQLEGLAGLQGRPVSQKVNNFENTEKEVINMPRGDGTGPTGQGAGTGNRNSDRAKGLWAAGKCFCSKCGFTVRPKHRENCNRKTCPKCGMKLTRALTL